MKPKDFKKLKAEWYSKLKDSGFKDIEKKSGQLTRGAPRLDDRAQVQVEAIESYYRMARIFLIEYKFEDEIQKTVWELHSEGVSTRDISDILTNQLQYTKCGKSKIIQMVKKLSIIMKNMYLRPECQNS